MKVTIVESMDAHQATAETIEKSHLQFTASRKEATVKEMLKIPFVCQGIRYALVGGVGLVIDMTCLCIMQWFGWTNVHLVLCKCVAAQIALISNFILNDKWSFASENRHSKSNTWLIRLAWFELVCGLGMLLGAVALKIQHHHFGIGLIRANLTSIVLVAFVNYSLARLAWRK